MKTFWLLNNKKLIIITFLLTVLLIILISCQKNKEIFETERKNNELLLEEKLFNCIEKSDDKLFSDYSSELPPSMIMETPNFSDDSVELPPRFKDMSNLYGYNMELLYKYDGYWTMNFDEYFRLDDRNDLKGIDYVPKGRNDTK